MFISKREAEDRLTKDQNIFRKPITQVRGEDGSDIESPDDSASEAEQDPTCDTVSNQHQDLSLHQLDDLLHPRIHGRAQYRNRLESQVAIAETELIIGEAKTARTFNLSIPQTDAYSKGLRTTADITNNVPPKPALISRINKIKEELAEKAAARLDLTLDALSSSKIGDIKRATNLSKVAKDMAVILDKCTENKDDNRGGVHFHIFVPDPVDATRYPTVTVGPVLDAETTPSS